MRTNLVHSVCSLGIVGDSIVLILHETDSPSGLTPYSEEPNCLVTWPLKQTVKCLWACCF